jgi:hypothetical protein
MEIAVVDVVCKNLLFEEQQPTPLSCSINDPAFSASNYSKLQPIFFAINNLLKSFDHIQSNLKQIYLYSSEFSADQFYTWQQQNKVHTPNTLVLNEHQNPTWLLKHLSEQPKDSEKKCFLWILYIPNNKNQNFDPNKHNIFILQLSKDFSAPYKAILQLQPQKNTPNNTFNNKCSWCNTPMNLDLRNNFLAHFKYIEKSITKLTTTLQPPAHTQNSNFECNHCCMIFRRPQGPHRYTLITKNKYQENHYTIRKQLQTPATTQCNIILIATANKLERKRKIKSLKDTLAKQALHAEPDIVSLNPISASDKRPYRACMLHFPQQQSLNSTIAVNNSNSHSKQTLQPPNCYFILPHYFNQPQYNATLLRNEKVFLNSIILIWKRITELTHLPMPNLQSSKLNLHFDSDLCAYFHSFATSLSSAKWLLHRGVQPNALIGFGIGFLATLVLSKALDLDSALDIILEYHENMEKGPKLQSIMINMPHYNISFLTDAHVKITCILKENATIISGTAEALKHFERKVYTYYKRRFLRIIPIANYPCLQDISTQLATKINTLTFSTPSLPLVDANNGQHFHLPEELNTALQEQLCQTHRPTQCFTNILEKRKPTLWLEVGQAQHFYLDTLKSLQHLFAVNCIPMFANNVCLHDTSPFKLLAHWWLEGNTLEKIKMIRYS